MQKIFILLIAIFTFVHLSFGQDGYVNAGETKFHVSNEAGDEISVQVFRNAKFVGKTNQKGYIVFKSLKEGDTIIFKLNSIYIPHTYVHNSNPESQVDITLSWTSKTESEIVEDVQESASFPGDYKAMRDYLTKNLKYPERATELGIEGKCWLRFVVNEDGTISDVKVSRGIPGCPECDAEAIRLVNNMPRWNPAKVNKKPVKSSYDMPLLFSLQ